jgi:hypothetical protein
MRRVRQGAMRDKAGTRCYTALCVRTRHVEEREREREREREVGLVSEMEEREREAQAGGFGECRVVGAEAVTQRR